VLAAAGSAGARPVVHCCAADVPVDLVVRAGAAALMVDVGLLELTRYDDLATAIEAGVDLWPGVVPTEEPAPRPGAEQLAGSVHRLWSALGHSPAGLIPRTTVTPACGLAGARPGWARSAMSFARDVAGQLSAQG
jgi:hypothetical protein